MNISEFINIFENCEILNDKIIIKNNLFKAVEFIKNNYYFDMLKEIIGIDNNDGTTELIYVLYSSENEEEVKLSVTVEKEAESVSKIFDSAIADEKEIYDLLGINFTDNNELERLYMPESWEGHPLRKDYIESDERLAWNE